MKFGIIVKTPEELQTLNDKFHQQETKCPAIYLELRDHVYPHHIEETQFLQDSGYLMVQLT